MLVCTHSQCNRQSLVVQFHPREHFSHSLLCIVRLKDELEGVDLEATHARVTTVTMVRENLFGSFQSDDWTFSCTADLEMKLIGS